MLLVVDAVPDVVNCVRVRLVGVRIRVRVSRGIVMVMVMVNVRIHSTYVRVFLQILHDLDLRDQT